ncbi:hypothetical protein FOG18_00790 [Legionella israelensis]|uniref:hypothetical protein n=1 Tax=Legionella israelensis TaxID=454 RepID=UPI00117CF7CD|nr:hypothetical protein [Legionella israelensis]QDP71223.1 hypothetical protein FOG18_00790 [Legionella israelensis]
MKIFKVNYKSIDETIDNLREYDAVDFSECELPFDEWRIKKIVSKLPDNIKSISFRELNLANNQDFLTNIFTKIPNHVTDIDISDNRLSNLSEDEVCQIFCVHIPQHVTNVRMYDVFLNLSTEKCITILNQFPEHFQRLSFPYINVCKSEQVEKFLNIIQQLSENIYHLGITHLWGVNSSNEYEFLNKVLGVLPEQIAHFDISSNMLHDYDGLSGVLANVPETVFSIDLSDNMLHKFACRASGQDLSSLLRHLHRGINSIKVSKMTSIFPRYNVAQRDLACRHSLQELCKHTIWQSGISVMGGQLPEIVHEEVTDYEPILSTI